MQDASPHPIVSDSAQSPLLNAAQARRAVLGAGFIAMLFAALTLGLHHHGKRMRVVGRGLGLAARPPTVLVATAEEAFRAWRARGVRGRVVVSLSSRLYFVEEQSQRPERSPDGRVLDPGLRIERILSPQGFLLAAMERGIAREVIHVLPPAAFAEKAAAVRGAEGIGVNDGGIDAPHLGSPRFLTTLDRLAPPTEPVLLFVSASFPAERGARQLVERLDATGLTADLVVLCESHDDPEVTPEQRARLADLAGLLGASPP